MLFRAPVRQSVEPLSVVFEDFIEPLEVLLQRERLSATAAGRSRRPERDEQDDDKGTDRAFMAAASPCLGGRSRARPPPANAVDTPS